MAYTTMYENQARFWRAALSLSIGNCLWIQIVQEGQLLHQLISAARDPRLTECLPSLTKLIGDPQQGQQAGAQIKLLSNFQYHISF